MSHEVEKQSDLELEFESFRKAFILDTEDVLLHSLLYEDDWEKREKLIAHIKFNRSKCHES